MTPEETEELKVRIAEKLGWTELRSYLPGIVHATTPDNPEVRTTLPDFINDANQRGPMIASLTLDQIVKVVELAIGIAPINTLESSEIDYEFLKDCLLKLISLPQPAFAMAFGKVISA
jgi:hypothetical protein